MRSLPFATAGLVCVLYGSAAAGADPSAQYDPGLFSGMKWRQVGPFRGGRVLAVTGVPSDPNTYYFGAAAGGVWKSTNGGVSWTPVFDQQDIASIGAIAVAPSNPNVIYVGTGEGCIRGNISYGAGVYKSVDAGKTWKNVGLRDTRHIGRLVIDPKNPDRVFVAALGHAFGPNAERGVFRTLDGGKTWAKVLSQDDDTGAIEVQLDPHDARVVYAGLWQVRRQPWNLSSGGPGSGLYKSLDGGTTWKRLSGGGLPLGIYGRIGIAISPANSKRVYASIEASEGGLFRSDDAGATWARVNADERFRQRAWYFSHVFADPKSADTVFALNTGLFKSTNGGKTFELLPAPHGDHHGLWIDPADPRRMINGNDGGATITVDGGKTWTLQSNQPTAQFYHVIADDQFPYRIYGTQQDNSTVSLKTYGDQGVITPRDWEEVAGAETGYVAPDPRDPDVIFTSNEHWIQRYNRRTSEGSDVSVTPLDVSGNAAAVLAHRFQWTSPLIAPAVEPGVLYAAGEAVFRSTDNGHSWTAISGDLTRNDKSKQQPSGGPIQLDITSVEYYGTVFALAESPLAKGMLWAGTDDGLVWLARDTKTWKQITPPGLPEWGTVSQIDPSPHLAGGAYVAVDRHRLDDFKAYAWRTSDFGASWTPIAAGIPDGAFVHAVREDPKRRGLLYAGTELGVFVSFDDGARWQPLQLNLPVTPINDLIVHGDDLVVATNGRSFWILDDLAPLRQLGAAVASSAIHFYAPANAWRIYYDPFPNKRRPVGDNGPAGAVFDYYLAKPPKGELTIEIFDEAGKPVRHLSAKPPTRAADQPPEWVDLVRTPDQLPAAAGMNRFVWDLRWSEPTQIPGAFYSGLPPWGPVVPPGQYTVKLSVDGQTQTQPLKIINDPRVKAKAADIRASSELGLKTRALIDALHVAVNQIRATRAGLKSVRARLGSAELGKQVSPAMDAIDAKAAAVEAELIQVKLGSSEGILRFPAKLNEQLDNYRQQIESDEAPSQPLLDLYSDLSGRLEAQLAPWRTVLKVDIPALNKQVAPAGVGSIQPDATPVPAPSLSGARD